MAWMHAALLFVVVAAVPPAVVPTTEPPTPAPPTPAPTAPALPTPAEILRRSADAIGGAEAWRRMRGRTMRWTLSFPGVRDATGTPQSITGTRVVIADAADRMRSTTTIPGVGDFEQGFDGTTGWSMDGSGGARLLAEPELAEVRREALFNRAVRLAEIYPRMETVEATRFDDRDCWLVRLWSADGRMAQAYFERDSGLLAGLSRTLPFSGTERSVTELYRDWKEFDGLRFPGRVETLLGPASQVAVLDSVEHCEIEERVFELPDPIRFLRDAQAERSREAPKP